MIEVYYWNGQEYNINVYIRDRLNSIHKSKKPPGLCDQNHRNQLIAELEGYQHYDFYIQNHENPQILQVEYDNTSTVREVLSRRIDELLYILRNSLPFGN